MNDNKIETTDTISFHNLHTLTFPSRGGDVTAIQKVNDVHELEKQENQANNIHNFGDINDEISVLYFNDVKNNVISSKINKNNIFSISFAEAKSKSVPVIKMGKTRKRSHSAQGHSISLTSRLYSNYVHKTLSWLHFLGNSDTKANKLKKSLRKSKRDNATSNPLLKKESPNPSLNKNKKYKAVETNYCNVKVLYKNELKLDKAINTAADTDKYRKKQTKLKKQTNNSTNPNYFKTDNNEVANVLKECVETDKNEHKSHSTKTRKDRYEGNIIKRAKKHSDRKKVKSNFKEFTSELKDYFGLEQIGNCVPFQENPLQPVNSENNLNKMKKKKKTKHRVRKSLPCNKNLRSYQSTPFGNEKVVEFSHQETKSPSLHKCRLARCTTKKKRNNIKGNGSILSIHRCTISNRDFCESQALLYSYQKYPNNVPKSSFNKRNQNSRHKKNIPSIEYKPLIVPIDKGMYNCKEDRKKKQKVVDYHKRQCKDTQEGCITYSPKGNMRKTWCNILCYLQRGRSRRKTRSGISNHIHNKENVRRHRKRREAQCVNKNKERSDSVIFNNVGDRRDPRYDPNIPIHRRFAKLLFDVRPPRCETCSYHFNRKPLITDLFLFPIIKKRNSNRQIMKKMCMCTASTLLLLPYWICFLVCRCLKG